MPRLRTTSTLSLLALIIGIAGTGWLSTLTSQWRGKASPLVEQAHPHSAVAAARHRHDADRIVRHMPRHREATLARARSPEFSTSEPQLAATVPELRPVLMPTGDSRPWQTLRGHLDGRVLMHLQIDGDGRVITASVATSSGDSVLDAHALDSVRHWLFVVPDGHPDGIEGDLPMRFASAGSGLAAAP